MRKEVRYTVDNPLSRDNGKEFIITEMYALEGEELSQDLFRIMGQQGFTGISDDVISMGCAGLATLGLPVLTAASKEVSLHLRDTLLKTIEIVITHEGNTQRRPLNPRIDLEEVQTIRILLDKVFQVNFDFLGKGSE